MVTTTLHLPPCTLVPGPRPRARIVRPLKFSLYFAAAARLKPGAARRITASSTQNVSRKKPGKPKPRPGTADKSYGIHVARLAGMPGEVIERAREILANLEEGELEAGMPKLAKKSRKRNIDIPGQLTLF